MTDKDVQSSLSDLGTLIRQALDDRPPRDLPERVMAKLALTVTAVELFRLATEAPLTALFDEETKMSLSRAKDSHPSRRESGKRQTQKEKGEDKP